MIETPFFKHLILALISLCILNSCGDEIVNYETNEFAFEGMTFPEAMKFWKNSDAFKRCKLDGLEPLDVVKEINEADLELLLPEYLEHSGDELAMYAVEFAENLDIEIPARERDKFIMFMFDLAAQQGSAVAMSEVGGSLLYCHQHVQQDIPQAETWLQKGVEGGDIYAMHSLARMHLAGFTKDKNSKQKAFELLSECSQLMHPDCTLDYEKLSLN